MKRKYSFIVYILLIMFTAASCGVNPATATAGSGNTQEPAVSESAASAQDPGPSASEPEETASQEASPSPSAENSPEPSKTPPPKPSKTPEKPKPSEADKKAEFIKKTKTLKSGAVVNVKGMDSATLNACFFYVSIPDSIFKRMEGKSFKKDCTTKRSDLRYVKTLYYGFDKKTHVGELVVNKAIAKDTVGIFRDLYKAKYPIEKMKLIDDYDADDNASMADNNTSSFNFRHVEGSKSLSQHAYGRAIDINTKYNPYIVTIKGKRKIEPPNGKKYADRSIDLPYIIHKGDICEKTFRKYGFAWGGDWRPDEDYQHFSKKK